MKLTFLGIGQMGLGMAARLAQAGLNICVYNRTIEKCAPLREMGATVASTPMEAVANAGIIFTMLSDDAALQSVMNTEVIKRMPEDAIHISMSTISVALSAQMSKEHTAMGRAYLACPVFGRPDAAAAGQLRLCMAGNLAHKEKVMPYLSPMGKVWDFGESPENANAVKLAGNFMICSMVELLSEAFLLVENNGVPPGKFAQFISSTLFAAPIVQLYSQLILHADFDNPGFTARLAAKDMSLVRSAAKQSKTLMPFSKIVEERFLEAIKKGLGEKDMTIISRAPHGNVARPMPG
ncbi:MAG: NAD(P)-dependent oxidoreductase [Burkholderiaceae bacterium]|jgi:3-hydroxyisobutyrate dehydrogenase-like beta-hydroxyacid dehydrogenase|nr:NAD(P)-dependent oxidoreductase [Burkholderiaceae bacterium]